MNSNIKSYMHSPGSVKVSHCMIKMQQSDHKAKIEKKIERILYKKCREINWFDTRSYTDVLTQFQKCDINEIREMSKSVHQLLAHPKKNTVRMNGAPNERLLVTMCNNTQLMTTVSDRVARQLHFLDMYDHYKTKYANKLHVGEKRIHYAHWNNLYNSLKDTIKGGIIGSYEDQDKAIDRVSIYARKTRDNPTALDVSVGSANDVESSSSTHYIYGKRLYKVRRHVPEDEQSNVPPIAPKEWLGVEDAITAWVNKESVKDDRDQKVTGAPITIAPMPEDIETSKLKVQGLKMQLMAVKQWLMQYKKQMEQEEQLNHITFGEDRLYEQIVQEIEDIKETIADLIGKKRCAGTNKKTKKFEREWDENENTNMKV